MMPPIRQCPNGHIICDVCSGKPQCASCPQCRASPTNIRNLALEQATEELTLTCQHSDLGCSAKRPYLEMGKHNCPFAPFTCTVHSQASCNTMLKMNAEDILQHIVHQHGVATSGDASKAVGGLQLEYKHDEFILGHGWPDRLIQAIGKYFLLHVVACGTFYEISVQCLTTDCAAQKHGYSITVESKRYKMLWEAVVRGIALSRKSKTMTRSKFCIPQAWAENTMQDKGCDRSLVFHLVIWPKELAARAIEIL